MAEHLAALDASSFEGPFVVGLVGSPIQRAEALSEISAKRRVDDVISVNDGAEQVTLNAVDRYADHDDGAVMYAHTKGAATPSHIQTDWRRQMTQEVILAAGTCAEALGRGYDAVGCYWVTSDQWLGGDAAVRHDVWGWGHFSGNFWVASCAFLRTLAPPSMVARFGAEAWLGSGQTRPRVLDLLPGSTTPNWAELARRSLRSPAVPEPSSPPPNWEALVRRARPSS